MGRRSSSTASRGWVSRDPARRLAIERRAGVRTQHRLQRRRRKTSATTTVSASAQRKPRCASVSVTAAQRIPTAANGRTNGKDRQEDPRLDVERERREGRQRCRKQYCRRGRAIPTFGPGQHARQDEQEQDPRQQIRHRVLLEQEARSRGCASARHSAPWRAPVDERQVVVDLPAEREVAPDLGEVPEIRRDHDGATRGPRPHPRQDRGGASPAPSRS